MYHKKYLSTKELQELMNQPSDEEDESPNQIQNEIAGEEESSELYETIGN